MASNFEVKYKFIPKPGKKVNEKIYKKNILAPGSEDAQKEILSKYPDAEIVSVGRCGAGKDAYYPKR